MSASLRRRLGRCARLAGYASAASVLCAWGWVERVSAEVEHTSLQLGARLAGELGDVVAEPQAIAVNGQRLWVASKTTPLSVSEALDRFDANCVSASEGHSLAERALIRRSEEPGRGGRLVCLAPREPFTGFVELGARLAALFASGELGPFGELRYAQATPRAEGGSHVVSVWSAEGFNLLDALPRDTDVPGDDPERAPRPPESTRILSADIPGRSYSIRSYRSERPATELAAFYASEMAKRGWALLDTERFAPETAPLAPLARAYSLGDAVTFVVVDDVGGASSARATATLVQMGAPGHANGGTPEAARD
ncbi:MAG TPA: hypothetical protein VMG12_35030 [Polyangiaceae bacterium]|nr:hypothetical protein [Polyangiaceae bacterium]